MIIYAISIVAFLMVLNGFLRGSKKTEIDAVLSLLLVGLIVTAFIVSGWKFGLLTIALAFISGIINRVSAARLASRLLSRSSGRGSFIGLPSRHLQRISQDLGEPFDPSKVMKEIHSRGNRENALFDYCEHHPTIEALLKEFKVSRSDLQELYRLLIMAGAGQWRVGHWVAASALAYPDSLRYLLTRKNEEIEITAFNLIMYFERGTPLG